MAIGTWFGQNILTKPEFFVGLLVFVGYLFLGKKIYEAVGGFIKATVDIKRRCRWTGNNIQTDSGSIKD